MEAKFDFPMKFGNLGTDLIKLQTHISGAES